jgi:hypothetical protein
MKQTEGFRDGQCQQDRDANFGDGRQLHLSHASCADWPLPPAKNSNFAQNRTIRD